MLAVLSFLALSSEVSRHPSAWEESCSPAGQGGTRAAKSSQVARKTSSQAQWCSSDRSSRQRDRSRRGQEWAAAPTLSCCAARGDGGEAGWGAPPSQQAWKSAPLPAPRKPPAAGNRVSASLILCRLSSRQRAPLNMQTPSSQFSSVAQSNSLRPHESQHARPPCPSPTPGVHSDSRPSSP